MTVKKTKTAEVDKWDTGELGRSEEHAAVVDDVDDAAIDAALELVPVSIRLQRSLIDDFKLIATHNGIGYQPLMRQVLTRFAVAETRLIANDLLEDQARREKEAKAQRRRRA